MKLKGLFEDRRFVYVVAALIVFSLIVLGINLFLLSKNHAPTNLNDFANVVCILVVAVFALRLWLTNRGDIYQNRIWGLLALGSILWAIAESIWFYLSLQSAETPYPSVADYFWLLGYLPFSVALLWRRIRYQAVATPEQRILNILVAATFMFAAGVFVIWPMVSAFDPARIVESALNVVYPVFDVMLSILVLNIFFSTQTGRFSTTWRLLASGFLLMTISDLMFSYTSWIGIYYPEGRANFISILLDVLYYNSYLLMAVGVYAFGQILKMDQGIRIGSGSTALTKSGILLFVDKNLQVISFSDNFLALVKDHEPQKYLTLPLGRALGLDSLTEDRIRSDALAHGSISSKPVVVQCADGTRTNAWLTAVAIFDSENQFTNLGIVLRATLMGKAAPPTSEQKGLMDHFLSVAGTNEREAKEIIQQYYLELIRLFYSIVRQFSGVKVADGLMDDLNQIAKKGGLPVSHVAQEIEISQEYDARTLSQAVLSLLRAARRYAADAASAEIVNEEIRLLNQNVNPEVLLSLDKLGLRLSTSGD